MCKVIIKTAFIGKRKVRSSSSYNKSVSIEMYDYILKKGKQLPEVQSLHTLILNVHYLTYNHRDNIELLVKHLAKMQLQL